MIVFGEHRSPATLNTVSSSILVICIQPLVVLWLRIRFVSGATTLRDTLEPCPVQIVGEQDAICRIGWCGQSPHKADPLLAPPQTEEQKQEKQEKTKLQQAMEWLKDYLLGGPKLVAQVHLDATKLGFSKRTTERAAHRLKVPFAKEGGEYRWSLPLPPDGEQASSTEPLPP